MENTKMLGMKLNGLVRLKGKSEATRKIEMENK